MTALHHRITAGLIIGSALGFGTLVATSQAAQASTAAAPAAQAAAHQTTAKGWPGPSGYYRYRSGYYNRFHNRFYNRYYPRYRSYSDCDDPCAYEDPCATYDPCC